MNPPGSVVDQRLALSENQLDSSDCEVGVGDDQLCYSERLRGLGGDFGGNGVLM
jgi:hypothetical protein